MSHDDKEALRVSNSIFSTLFKIADAMGGGTKKGERLTEEEKRKRDQKQKKENGR